MSSSPVIPPENLARASSALTALAHAGLPALEAHMLVSHMTGLSRVQLIVQDVCAIDVAARTHISKLATRYLAGELMTYLFGEREFFGRIFKVMPAMLIPRPDTELLVERALDHLEECDAPAMLDMDTGSGIIAITIALARRDARVWATDASTDVLVVATDNAKVLGVTSVQVTLGDWHDALTGAEAPPAFDLIASNPSYIAAADTHLDQGDLCFELASALTGHDDGLRHLRSIVAGAPTRLVSGRWLLIEHGYDRGEPVHVLLGGAKFADVFAARDLAGHGQYSGGQWPDQSAGARSSLRQRGLPMWMSARESGYRPSPNRASP